MNFKDKIAKKEFCFWQNAVLATVITKRGLTGIIKSNIYELHNAIVKQAKSEANLKDDIHCSNCFIQNILPCGQRKDICGSNPRKCKFHAGPGENNKPCRMNLCHKVYRLIIDVHEDRKPSWKNTDARKWFSEPWEIAKCFCPPTGYTDKHTAEETDLNGFLCILIYCSHFIQQFGTDANIFKSKAKLVGIYL